MPQLDVSWILDDPLFRDDTLVYTKQVQTIGEDGLARNAPETAGFSGVVTIINGQDMDRRPDGSLVRGSILVITRTPLQPGYTGRDADLVTWHGSTYTVVGVDDYGSYGGGTYQATCEIKPLTGLL